MSMLTFKLLACTVVRARPGGLAACSGEATVTDPSCDGDVALESSLLQTEALAATIGHSVPITKDFCRPEDGTPHARERKNIFDMDSDQWDNFKAAWGRLYDKGAYKKYAVEHTKHYRDDKKKGMFKDHKGAYGFLAFHRGQIQDLETELMQEAGDCDMAFPFWDWSMDVATFDTSEIWTDKYMGDGQGCVVSGLPSGWEYAAKGVANPCVERMVKPTHALPDSRKISMEIQGTADFRNFVKDLEGVHNIAHGAIGGRSGNMASKVGKASPSDPMFYLHHAFIDSIYFRWQQTHHDTSSDLLRDDLVPLIGKYTEEHDCVYLPVHRNFPDDIEATCVRYKETENVHPPWSALLQAYNADGDCVALQKQMGKNQCSFEELQDLVCVGTEECTLIEAEEFEDSALFETDAAAEKMVEMFLKKMNMKTKCKSYSSEYTTAEEHHCFKCNVPCKGMKK